MSRLFARFAMVLLTGIDIDGEVRKNTVYVTPVYLAVGIIGGIFFLFIIVNLWLDPTETENAWAYLGFGFFILLSVIIILHCILWKIEYNEEFFIYRNSLGRKAIVPYSSIVRIKRKQNNVYLYTEKRRYDAILFGTIGADDFLNMIAKHALVVHYDNVQPKKHRHKRTKKQHTGNLS